jgi:putative hydrolases of HD superfamily
MVDINEFRTIYKLKSVYRLNTVDNRHESSAEHSWSCLVLADYVLNLSKLKIDRLRVYELLMYHDLVEIYAGDTPTAPGIDNNTQKSREDRAAKRLIKELPKELSKKYSGLQKEFEELKTIESRFANAIDTLDAQLHELDHKKDWKGWTEKFLREKNTKHYQEFPVMMELFEEFLDYADAEGFFGQ